jgi:protein tyrosine/serine phosphatase
MWIDLEGAANARDVGGLPAAGGRATRPGVLVRSDAVHELTEADVAVLVERVGVRHVIDLRAPGERVEQARGRLGRTTTIVYSELDVVSDAVIEQRRRDREAAFARGDEPAAILAEGYLQLLEHGRSAFVRALDRLVAPGGTPALVHCSAGKDRTGVLVALLLDAADVEAPAIVADYAATDERMAGVRDRLAAMAVHAQLATETPGMLLAAHAATMELFLGRLHAEHGGGACWFLDAGAPAEALDAWRELLLSGDGPAVADADAAAT